MVGFAAHAIPAEIRNSYGSTSNCML